MARSSRGGARARAAIIALCLLGAVAPAHAANTPPTATIYAPPPSLAWYTGANIAFGGLASDPEQGSLPATAMTWTITLQHCPGSVCHAHPVDTFVGVTDGTFVAMTDGAPAHYDITLTVTDAGGLTATQTVTIDAASTSINLESDPAGLPLVYQGETIGTPVTRLEVVGATVTIAAPITAERADGHYRFVGWTDRTDPSRAIIAATTPQTFVAHYELAEDPAAESTGCTTSADPGWLGLVLGGGWVLRGARKRKRLPSHRNPLLRDFA